jgi:glycosyltransferase involved in cell wall biosynthesis
VSAHIILDLSRLLWRSDRFAPTGIDRVELAYARHLIATARDRLIFVGWWQRLGLMPDALALAFIDRLQALWSGDTVDPAVRKEVTRLVRRLRLAIALSGERTILRRARRVRAPLVYLLVSHYRLDRPKALARIKRRTGARFFCLIHDLIPIDYPEHVEQGDDEIHRRRLDTVEQLADTVIVNSEGTREALARHLAESRRRLPVLVAPLGVDLAPVLASERPRGGAYFIYIATIESRKNHLLLLRIWQRLVEEQGPAAPHLVLIGRRGWQHEKVAAQIAGSTALAASVDEYNSLPDAAVARLLAGATAALYPSFAEGYGLPVAEALALEVPVICSDLPELREVGRHVPEYLDPGDAAAWHAMVSDYAAPGSLRRQAQVARLSGWSVPSWEQHFATVQPLIDETARPAPATTVRRGRVGPRWRVLLGGLAERPNAAAEPAEGRAP